MGEEPCGLDIEYYAMQSELARLTDENDKLRNFANRLWILLSRNEPCFVWKGMVDEACELGIEVDDE